MTDYTPNRGIPLMESSQSQPEVVFNAAMHILDGDTSLEVEQDGDSPGVTGVTKIKFVGATVSGSGHEATVTIDATSGGGGGSLELTDGTHDLTGVTKITVFGGTVGGTAGAATLTVDPTSGGSGGGAFNLSPDQHTSTPDFVENDEFEEAAGTAIDTAGTRFSSAVAWTWGNQGSSTAIQNGDGNLILTGQADGNYHGIYQPVPGGSWKRRCRVSLMNQASSAGDLASIFAMNSSNGHIVGFGPFANTPGCLLIKWNSWTSFNSTGYNTLPRNFTSQMLVQPTWYEMRSDGTTLTFAVSASGAEGSFIDVVSETIATFLGAVDKGGLSISTNSAPASSLITDLWRKY